MFDKVEKIIVAGLNSMQNGANPFEKSDPEHVRFSFSFAKQLFFLPLSLLLLFVFSSSADSEDEIGGSCMILVTKEGQMTPKNDLTSFTTSRRNRAVAEVHSSGANKVYFTLNRYFTIHPPNTPTNLIWSGDMRGRNISRGRRFTKRGELSVVTMRSGDTITRIVMSLSVKTTDGTPFPAGMYQAGMTLRCEP